MYITYSEYKEKGGKLDETAFFTYSYEAYKRISSETFNRIDTEAPGEAVKMCMVRVIDLLSDGEISSGRISSEAHDGHSTSYEKTSLEEYEKKISSLINTYLTDETDSNGVPLLYRGVV